MGLQRDNITAFIFPYKEQSDLRNVKSFPDRSLHLQVYFPFLRMFNCSPSFSPRTTLGSMAEVCHWSDHLSHPSFTKKFPQSGRSISLNRSPEKHSFLRFRDLETGDLVHWYFIDFWEFSSSPQPCQGHDGFTSFTSIVELFGTAFAFQISYLSTPTRFART